jgi:hypothetical protein
MMTSWLDPLIATLAAMGATPAAAQPAEAVQPPAAHVEAHAVVHAADGLTVRVPRAAVHVGSDRFVLYDVADCEIHVFVEADAQHRVRRLYWIQFEGYLPTQPGRRYNYADGNRRIDLGGTATWLRAAPANVSEPARAGSDRERVVAIVRRAGLILPADVLTVRMVQLLDDPQGSGRGRRELMLMYVEDLAPFGVTPADFLTDGAPNARWAATEQPLVARASAAFQVSRR